MGRMPVCRHRAPAPGDGVLVLGSVGCTQTGDALGCSTCGGRRAAGGFGERVSPPQGWGEGKPRQDARVPFLSSPLLVTVLTPPWPPLSHSGLPAGIFPPAKRRGMLPSPPGLWQPAVTAAACPGGRGPPAPPPHRGSLSPAAHRTRQSGVGWQRCSRSGTAVPDTQMPPVPIPPEPPLTPPAQGFCIRAGAWAGFWGVFFWQPALLASRNLQGAVGVIRGNLQQPGAPNNPLRRGTAGDLGPAANLGQS